MLKGSPAGLHIYVQDVDAAFDRAVEAGAKVDTPVMDQFWGDRYGRLTDPYGHKWSIATHVKDLSMDEMKRAMDEAMAQMRQQRNKPLDFDFLCALVVEASNRHGHEGPGRNLA